MLNNIPTTWLQKYLSDNSVAQVIMGQSPDSLSYNEEKEGLPFYQGKTDFGKVSPKPRVWCNKPVKIAEADDILLSVRAPVGAVNICTEKSCIGRGLCAIRAKEIVLPKFLYYFFVFYEPILKTQGSGAVFDAITKAFIDKIKLPIPPTLAEQQEIVQVLDAMSDIIRLREECIKHAQDLIPAIFQEMFGDPIKNQKGYEKYRIKDLGKVITGTTPSSSKENMFGGSIPFITPGDLETGNYEYNRYLTEEGAKNSRIIRAGSTMVCCIGSIGKADIAKIPSAFNQQINSIEWNSKLIDDKFALYLFRHLAPLIKSKASRSVVPILNKTNFENISIPKPDLKFQKQFAQKALEIENYIQEQQEELKNAEQMFQSLLHHAFTGKLTSLTRVDLLTKQLVLHAKIIDKCNMQPTFGAVKLEKIFNICDMIQELNLAPIGYYRKAAGPYIPEMRYAVEKELEQRQWVKISNNKNGKRVEYKKDVHFSEYKNLYSKIFENKLNGIENIIQYFINKDTDYCEAFSTLYMCWNDLLIEGKKPSKFEIIDEFKNHWAPEKQRFDRIYLLEILSDISNNNFEPKGKGLHTINSDYNINKNQLNLQLN